MMKKAIYLIALVIWAIACNNKNNDVKHDTIHLETKQNKKLIQDSIKSHTNKFYQVSGIIMHKKTWCGGVQIKPNDNTYKIKPFNKKKIYVIKGLINSDTCKIVKEIYTNSKGAFSFDIESGDYGIIIEDWKQTKFRLPTYNFESMGMIKCLKKEYKKPDIKLKVTNKPISNLSYTIIEYCTGGNVCNPCGGTGRP